MHLATDKLVDPAPSGGSSNHIGIRDYFNWLQENFLRISLTDDNNVPEIIARVFEYLCKVEDIRLVEAGDASSVGLVNTPNPPTMEPSANSIEVRE
jgi:hypothetical protein